MKKISIIIPLYNGQKYIERCINSIIRQKIVDIEIIIVNDASKDDSLQIVKKLCALDSRIYLLNKVNNEGPMIARNDGLKIATGEYCFFCDSDDWLPDNSLFDLYKAAHITGYDIIIGDVLRINKKGQTYKLNRSKYVKDSPLQYLEAIYSGVICSMCGILYKTSFLRNANVQAIKGVKMSEDRLVLSKILLLNPKILGLQKNTYYYYCNKDSSTNVKLSNKALKLQINTLKTCYKLIRNENVINEVLDKWFARYLLYYIEQGYYIKQEFSHDPDIHNILTFINYRKICGIKLALHFFLCQNFKFYRYVSQTGRHVIRKLQHKE